MTVKRDPDAILAAWLEDGPVALPEPTRRAIAVTTRTTTRPIEDRLDVLRVDHGLIRTGDDEGSARWCIGIGVA